MSEPTTPSTQEISPSGRVIVVGDDGVPSVAAGPGGGPGGAPGEPGADEGPARLVSAPDKVMRIGTMVKQLLDEVRAAPLDDRSRVRLRELHQQSIRELSEGLAPELREELTRLALPLDDNEVPSDAELRIAQAQLVGWLEGLFHGIQAALVAQQVNAQALLAARGRGQLPPGSGAGLPAQGQGTGQYL